MMKTDTVEQDRASSYMSGTSRNKKFPEGRQYGGSVAKCYSEKEGKEESLNN